MDSCTIQALADSLHQPDCYRSGGACYRPFGFAAPQWTGLAVGVCGAGYVCVAGSDGPLAFSKQLRPGGAVQCTMAPRCGGGGCDDPGARLFFC